MRRGVTESLGKFKESVLGFIEDKEINISEKSSLVVHSSTRFGFESRSKCTPV